MGANEMASLIADAGLVLPAQPAIPASNTPAPILQQDGVSALGDKLHSELTRNATGEVLTKKILHTEKSTHTDKLATTETTTFNNDGSIHFERKGETPEYLGVVKECSVSPQGLVTFSKFHSITYNCEVDYKAGKDAVGKDKMHLSSITFGNPKTNEKYTARFIENQLGDARSSVISMQKQTVKSDGTQEVSTVSKKEHPELYKEAEQLRSEGIAKARNTIVGLKQERSQLKAQETQ